MRNAYLLLMTVFVFAATAGCLSFRSAPNGIYSGTMAVVYGGRSKPTKVVLDSPAVRQVVAAYELKEVEIHGLLAKESHTLQEERRWILPGHTGFLEAMARAPQITVKENTRCRVLEISKARCDPAPVATVTYLRVLLTNGPSKGQQVWICRNPYSLPFESP